MSRDSDDVPKTLSNVPGDLENVPNTSPNVPGDSEDVPRTSNKGGGSQERPSACLLNQMIADGRPS